MATHMTIDQIEREISRLEVVFPRSADKVTRSDLAKAWSYVLEGIEHGELRQAVNEYLRGEHSYFPKPGAMRALALKYRVQEVYGERAERARDWNETLDGPCPVCGARLRILTAEEVGEKDVWDPAIRGMRRRRPEDTHVGKRFGVLHDLAAHKRAGVPAVGYWK